MISHVHLGVADFGKAFSFYSAIFEILGFKLKFTEPENFWAGWMPGDRPRPLIIIGKPYNGEPASPGNGHMVAFLADNRECVRKSYEMALKLGGTDEGAPDLRPQYHENYYGAYFRDLDGNKICVCCHSAEQT